MNLILNDRSIVVWCSFSVEWLFSQCLDFEQSIFLPLVDGNMLIHVISKLSCALHIRRMNLAFAS
jgi:hypothetical protein